MPKTTLKEVIQDSLPVLADIGSIITTWSAGDASSFLQNGAVLLAVAKVEKKNDLGPFRYVLGWRRSSGKPPQLWKSYNPNAGQE